MPKNAHDNYRVRFFKRTFQAEYGQNLTIEVSADSRYLLWFNGRFRNSGPVRGDITHHFYDTQRLSQQLENGENVIAAMVIYCGDVMPTYKTTGAPCGLMTGAPGFIVNGALLDDEGREIETLHSDERWLVREDSGAFLHEHTGPRGSYTGFTERFRGAHYPWGWNEIGGTSEGFVPATVIFPGVTPENVRDSFMPHRLMDRPICSMESEPQRFTSVADGDTEWQTFLPGDQELTIPAHTRVEKQLSIPAQTTSLMDLKWRGGAGSMIRLTYAEMLTQDGVRQYNVEPVGEVIGVDDEIYPGGGQESWQSWYYRTFRHVKVEIETADEPLILENLSHFFWAYPFDLRADFRCDDPFFAKLLEVGYRTLRLCSHETYEDCPYYEQLSYAGDNFVTGRAAALLTGDSDLTAHTIRQFFWSRHPEGLTMSRYPCRMPQIIPAWSQLWLLTVRDYYHFTAEAEVVREVWDGIRSVLAWFEGKRENGGLGLVGALNYWCVLDWSPDWAEGTDESGVPPGTYREASAANNFLHLWCLRAAAEMAGWLRMEDVDYRSRAEAFATQVHQAFWDEERGAYRDRVAGPEFSQLTNALAILSGAAPQHLWDRIAPCLTDPSHCRAGYFGEQFVLDALAKVGRFGECWDAYEVYRQLIEVGGNTTLPEAPSIPRRSECHAWSVGCVNSLFTHGLGIQPLEPGWKSVLIAPQPGPRTFLKGKVPVSHSEIRVEMVKDGENWSLKGFAPDIPVTVKLPGKEPHYFPHGGNFLVR